MALERLAGPFSPLSAAGYAILFSQPAYYDDRYGLISSGLISASVQGYRWSQLDGRTYLKGESTFGNFGHGKLVFDLETDDDWLTVNTLVNQTIHPFNLQFGYAGTAEYSGATNTFNGVGARTSTHYLKFANSTVQSVPRATPEAAYATDTILTGYGFAEPKLSKTRSPDVLCLAYGDGKIIFYNWRTKLQVAGAAFLPANQGAWYSPRHDFYVTHISNQISIYANAVLPTAISVPSASPSLTKGMHSTISVTATGSNGEVAAGELIDFELVGPGTLLAEQATTNASGVASVGYIAPLTLSTNPQFNASLVI